MPYADAHIHPVPDALFWEAREKGVSHFLCTSLNQAQWPEVLALASRVTGVIPALGIHPAHAAAATPGWEAEMDRLLRQHPQARVGDVGLDRTQPAFAAQKDIFVSALQLARRHSRTAHISCVDAWDELFLILGQFRDLKVLFHHFSGDEVVAQKLKWFNAFYAVLHTRGISIIPEGRILVESGAPEGLSSPALLPDLVQKLQLKPADLWHNWEFFLHD